MISPMVIKKSKKREGPRENASISLSRGNKIIMESRGRDLVGRERRKVAGSGMGDRGGTGE